MKRTRSLTKNEALHLSQRHIESLPVQADAPDTTFSPRSKRSKRNNLYLPGDQATLQEKLTSGVKADNLYAYDVGLPDGIVLYIPDLFMPTDCGRFYTELLQLDQWTQPILTVYGVKKLQSRQVCAFGNSNAHFRYSGARLEVHELLPSVASMIQEVVQHRLSGFTATNGKTDHKFNSLLLNRYDDGSVYIGAHSDLIKDHVEGGLIACVSLGAKRTLVFTHKKSKHKTKIQLHDGSLLVMAGETQQNYTHEIPKEPKIREGRISLTFRQRTDS
jgi:alkylated DNA repair dioxygenase AlkB